MKIIKAKAPTVEALTEAALEQAIVRGESRCRSGLQAATLSYQEPCLAIGFADGTAILLPVQHYPEFEDFSPEELHQLELGFAGTAICHEGRDLQVSIAGLISASQPLMDMAAQVVASRNGSRSSEAKAQAARLNGKKGGRPRKVQALS
ncbi:DUF2442 domain-containing protein [Pseudomonas sp. NPDC089530]|uniref:DUF2442 domain-containing protein n=1 Tax=Pseudomonas sp. NPDC089530 TaxID=3390651 RepID=UPI003CFF9821